MSSRAAARVGQGEWAAIAAALVVSVAIVALVTRAPILVGVYAGGLIALGAPAAALALRRSRAHAAEPAPPDWSVTVAAIDAGGEAVAITDRAGRLVCANRPFEAAFGVAATPPLLPLDEPSRQALGQAMRAAWRNGGGGCDRLQVAAGGRAWRAAITRGGRGEDFLVWRFPELTAGDPVAELAEQLGGELGTVLARGELAAALVDPAGTILAANPTFADQACGDPREPVAGRAFAELVERGENRETTWTRDAGHGRALVVHELPVDTGAAPLYEAIDPAAWLMLLAPARRRAASQGERGEALALLEALLAQLPLGLAIADGDGRLAFANPAFMRAVGREGEPAPLYPTDLVAREDKAIVSEALRRHARGPIAASELTLRLAAKPGEPVSLSLAGIRGLGEPMVVLGFTDSLEQVQLKRQVAQATKMQAIGQLAGGVAHDFNNILTAILGTCDLMLMRHMPGDSDYDDIQQIRASSNRAASLTGQLLAFSRQQTLRPQVLQLPDVVSDTTQLLMRLIGGTIEFKVSHDRDLGPVLADPGQLGQVILNLVVNARDAIQARGDGRGRVSLTTRRIAAEAARALGSEILPAGEYTALFVEDDGVGIAPELLANIFEPFFTTKEQGKGTGLGLATVYGFVRQSGGFIFAESEVGRGTRFSIYLPVHDAPAALAAPAEPARSDWGTDANILLVEDEEPVRLVTERALARKGYSVTPARDGEEGLDLVRGGAAFDLVVSDVVMPSMNGPAMARAIREIAPRTPVLFMSGYAEEQLRKEINLSDVHFITKPFSVQQISDKVGEVLGGR